jgi:hypothetical protein
LPLDPRFAGSNPAEGDRFLRVIKICSTPSFRRETDPSAHIVRFYGMLKNRSKYKRDTL